MGEPHRRAQSGLAHLEEATAVTEEPRREPTRLERWSVPGALLLSRIPKPLLLILIAGLLITALIVEGVVGGLLLLLLGAFFAWLLMLAWPALTGTGRLVRLLVVALIAFFAGDMIATG
jgi:uncharacterized membrane protein